MEAARESKEMAALNDRIAKRNIALKSHPVSAYETISQVRNSAQQSHEAADAPSVSLPRPHKEYRYAIKLVNNYLKELAEEQNGVNEDPFNSECFRYWIIRGKYLSEQHNQNFPRDTFWEDHRILWPLLDNATDKAPIKSAEEARALASSIDQRMTQECNDQRPSAALRAPHQPSNFAGSRINNPRQHNIQFGQNHGEDNRLPDPRCSMPTGFRGGR